MEQRVTRTANTKESKGTRRAGFKVKRDALEVRLCTTIDNKRAQMDSRLETLGANKAMRKKIRRALETGRTEKAERLLKSLTD